MNARNVFVFLAGAALFTFVVMKLAEQASEPRNSRVAHLVEDTLHQHTGEDSPVVHAFEAALEKV